MSYTLIFNEEAQQEYQQAFEWYEEQLTGLGDKFETTIENHLIKIRANAFAYHFSKGKFREIAVTQFPFSIVYKVYTKKKIIYISSIHHTSKHPKEKYRH